MVSTKYHENIMILDHDAIQQSYETRHWHEKWSKLGLSTQQLDRRSFD